MEYWIRIGRICTDTERAILPALVYAQYIELPVGIFKGTFICVIWWKWGIVLGKTKTQ
jgi:hypothetical protein